MKEGVRVDKSVEFFFDVGSPASYLAWTQLPSLHLRFQRKMKPR